MIEPNVSRLSERFAALEEAHRRGLQVYGMLCPILPGISDSHRAFSDLIVASNRFGAEEIFVEPINARSPALRLTDEALVAGGFKSEPAAIEKIRTWDDWSPYCADLLSTVQHVTPQHGLLEKFRFLLYPTHLTDRDLQRIQANDSRVMAWGLTFILN